MPAFSDMSNTTCCPLCGGIVAKFTISFHADFVMCSNEDCVYPFQDNKSFKASVFDRRPPASHSGVRKRKPAAVPDNPLKVPVQPGPALVKKQRLIDPTKSDSTGLQQRQLLSTAANISAVPLVATNLSSSHPTPGTNTSEQRNVATSVGPISMPPTSMIPTTMATTTSSAVPSSTPSSTTASPSVKALSPMDVVPDLTFDFLPSESWITPVTPPDKLALMTSNTLKDTSGLSTTSTAGSASMATASSLADLLFNDDDFDLDFRGMDTPMGAPEFDAAFEAMLQQQF
ncbi:hypothetical protein EDD11_004084 [Mortierella claussenii]|nr:hypothetical protein EDD11_004084 [Mortierella claussenii]